VRVGRGTEKASLRLSRKLLFYREVFVLFTINVFQAYAVKLYKVQSLLTILFAWRSSVLN